MPELEQLISLEGIRKLRAALAAHGPPAPLTAVPDPDDDDQDGTDDGQQHD